MFYSYNCVYLFVGELVPWIFFAWDIHVKSICNEWLIVYVRTFTLTAPGLEGLPSGLSLERLLYMGSPVLVTADSIEVLFWNTNTEGEREREQRALHSKHTDALIKMHTQQMFKNKN